MRPWAIHLKEGFAPQFLVKSATLRSPHSPQTSPMLWSALTGEARCMEPFFHLCLLCLCVPTTVPPLQRFLISASREKGDIARPCLYNTEAARGGREGAPIHACRGTAGSWPLLVPLTKQENIRFSIRSLNALLCLYFYLHSRSHLCTHLVCGSVQVYKCVSTFPRTL